MKSALIYGTCTGKTEAVADKILAALDGVLDLEKVDAGAITAEDLTKWDFVICGIPTWDVGQLEYCWQDIYEQLDNVDCSGLKVAMFGLGDQYSYQDTYQDAMGLLYKKLLERQAEGGIGFMPAEGHTHSSSEARVGDDFCGLAIDEENQDELTDGRIDAWVAKLKTTLGLE